MKALCLITIQGMIEENDGKRSDAANGKCIFNLNSPYHLTVQLESDLFYFLQF